ncbi:MAG: signal peptidase I [Clostridiales bacterium]|nr:signal peptidase I [Clostridiales bacterium]
MRRIFRGSSITFFGVEVKRKTKQYWIKYAREDDDVPLKRWSFLYEAISSVSIAIVIIFLIFTFVFRTVGVVGKSMMPTLSDGDWLGVRCINYRIHRGDIVIVAQPNVMEETLVKRVVAVGGDTVDIDFENGDVYLNGEIIDEPYIKDKTHLSYDVTFPQKVPEGMLFVMGDNRNNSLDSRSTKVGLIDERYILGVAKFRIYPAEYFRIY